MSATETLTWTKPSVSEETGQWADLVTLDLSKFDQPGGKQELAAEFTRAIEEVGKSMTRGRKGQSAQSQVVESIY